MRTIVDLRWQDVGPTVELRLNGVPISIVRQLVIHPSARDHARPEGWAELWVVDLPARSDRKWPGKFEVMTAVWKHLGLDQDLLLTSFVELNSAEGLVRKRWTTTHPDS